MKRTTALLLGLLVLFGLSSSAQAKVIFRGDFESGDINQWKKKEMVSPDRLQVVTDPVAQGTYALKITVRPGDRPINASGNRNELVFREDKPQEGDDRYYRWQTMFPEDFKSSEWYQIFVQWHQYITGGSPPLAFLVMGEEIKLGSLQHYFFSIPLERGIWQDWVAHIKWSSDPKVGGVEVWYNGKLILPFTHWATLFKNDTVYLKQGLYRKEIINWTQTIYQDGMTVGTELEDVWPTTPSKSTPTGRVAGSDNTGSTSNELGGGQEMSPELMQARAQMGCSSSVASAWMIPVLLVAALIFTRRRQKASRSSHDDT